MCSSDLANRSHGVNRPSGSALPSRPAAPMPSPPAPGDTRSWAERARALEHSTLPPAQQRENSVPSRESPTQTREYTDENYRPPQQAAPQDQSNEVYRPSSGGAAAPRDDRSPGAPPPGQVEQQRAPVNSYIRPQGESRAGPAPGTQQSPGTRYGAPPPAPVSTFPVPPPPPAPVSTRPVPSPPPVHAPSPGNRAEEHSAPRAPARMDPPH